MSKPDDTVYTLKVASASWLQAVPDKPNLYVKIKLEDKEMKTEVVKRNKEPSWKDATFLLKPKDASSSLYFRLKHDSGSSFVTNPRLGTVDISIKDLLDKCGDNQDTSLALKSSKDNHSIGDVGSITVQLSIPDLLKAAAEGNASAARDIQSAGIEGSANAVPSGVMPAMTERDPTLDDDADRVFTKALDGVVSKLRVFVQLTREMTTIHMYADLAWQAIFSLSQAVKDQKDSDERIVDLLKQMEDVQAFVNSAVESVPNKLELFKHVITKILQQTVECTIFIREYTGHGFARRLVTHHTSHTIIQMSENLANLKQSFINGAGLHTASVVSAMSQKVDKLIEMEALKMLNPVLMDAVSHPVCLPGTRQDILKFIINWLMTPSTSTTNQNVLWLHGLLGSGKSTLSTAIAEHFRGLHRLGAFLFFNRQDHTHSNPASVIQTLAYQLASYNPDFRSALCGSKGLAEKTTAVIQTQFRTLLLEPLCSLVLDMQGPVIIIIDALDECGTPHERKDLLALLSHELMHLPPNFRFLITSRKERDIDAVFSFSPSTLPHELDIDTQANTADIHSYLSYQMSAIRINKHMDFDLASDWPGENRICSLVTRSAGLFIWASTATAFIGEYDPEECLDQLLQTKTHTTALSALDELYATALRSIGQWKQSSFVSDFCTVLGIVLAARTPLSAESVDRLAGKQKHRPSKAILRVLGCFLHWDLEKPIQILHESFAAYLSSSDRCGCEPWFIDVGKMHEVIASACLRIMQGDLQFNICKLETSYLANKDVPGLANQIAACISPHLLYACCFWTDHVQNSLYNETLVGAIDMFLHSHLLHWLEVLSLVHQVVLATPALLSLLHWIKDNRTLERDNDNNLLSFTADASRFVTYFASCISESTPHIYLSALPFAPAQSKVAQHFLLQIPHIASFLSGKETQWPQMIQGHTTYVNSVVFSPDGKHIASGSDDKTIRVWDAQTGNVVSGPFAGHTDGVTSVAFSPNGKHIASGSDDKTIRVWDAQTGNMVSGPFTGHTGRVKSVAFSPDGKHIASGSYDRTIRVWDDQTGNMVSGPFKGHTSFVNSVAFFPDGKHIASGSYDQTIRVWDAQTGNMVSGPFEGHTDGVISVAFSPDGKHIASGSDDKTIRVWDAQTGNMVSGPFKGHTSFVTSVAFSPDAKHIASGSHDQTIRVWDAQTGNVVSGPFEGHTNRVNSVAFSPDGKHIASGSHDQTIRVWDAQTGNVVSGPFEGHTNSVSSVAFSHYAEDIASSSGHRIIHSWDAQTGNIPVVPAPFQGHAGYLTSLSLSPEGKPIVSGSSGSALQSKVAQLAARSNSDAFRVPMGEAGLIAFSPEVKHILCPELTESEHLLETGSEQRHLTVHLKDDGWAMTSKGDLLFWVPWWYRKGLGWPGTTAIMDAQPIILDLSQMAHGRKWEQCRSAQHGM